MSEVISVPREIKDVFKGVSAEIQSYLNSAQKFSKQQKHFYIGVEHLFAAFLSEQKSLMRRIIGDDKSNWKKRVQDLLMKAYNPSKRTQLWQGMLVTPRLQRIWDQAIQSTRFKDSTEVKEAHILAFMLKDKEGFPYRWLEGEDYRIDDFMARINQEAFPDGAGKDKAEKEEDLYEAPRAPERKAPDRREPAEEKRPEPAVQAPKMSLSDIFKKDQEPSPAREDTAAVKGLFSTSAVAREETIVMKGLFSSGSAKEEKKPPSRRDEGDSLKVGPDMISVKSLVDRGVSPAGINRLKEMQKKHGVVPPMLMIGAREVPFDELIEMRLEEEAFLEVLDIAEENVGPVSDSKDEAFPDMEQQSFFKGDKPGGDAAFRGSPFHAEPVAMGEGKPLGDLLKIALETQEQEGMGSDLDTAELRPLHEIDAERDGRKAVPDIGGDDFPDIGKRPEPFNIGYGGGARDMSAPSDAAVKGGFSPDMNTEKPLYIGNMTQSSKPAPKTGKSKVYDPFGLLGDVDEPVPARAEPPVHQRYEPPVQKMPEPPVQKMPEPPVQKMPEPPAPESEELKTDPFGIIVSVPEVDSFVVEDTPVNVMFADTSDLALDDVMIQSSEDELPMPFTDDKSLVADIESIDIPEPPDLLGGFPSILPREEPVQAAAAKAQLEIEAEPVRPEVKEIPPLKAEISPPPVSPSLARPVERFEEAPVKPGKNQPIVPRRRVMMPHSDGPLWMLGLKNRITLSKMQATMMEQARELEAIQRERKEAGSGAAVALRKEPSPPSVAENEAISAVKETEKVEAGPLPGILAEETLPRLPEIGGDVALPEFNLGMASGIGNGLAADSASAPQISSGEIPTNGFDGAISAFPQDDDLLSIFPDETFRAKEDKGTGPGDAGMIVSKSDSDSEITDLGLSEIVINLGNAGLQEMYPSDLWDEKEVGSVIGEILGAKNHTLLISKSLIKAGKVVPHLRDGIAAGDRDIQLYMLLCDRLSKCSSEDIAKHMASLKDLFASKQSAMLLSFDAASIAENESLGTAVFQLLEYLSSRKIFCLFSMSPKQYRASASRMAKAEKLFKRIMISEVTSAQAREFLKGSKEAIEMELKISIESSLIEQAAELADKFLTEKIFPESIIEVFRKASHFKREEFGDIGLDEIEHIDKKDFLYILSDSSL